MIRSLRKFKNVNVVVPFCESHAGWIGVRLCDLYLVSCRESLFELESTSGICCQVRERKDFARDLTKLQIFESPSKVMMRLSGFCALSVSVSQDDEEEDDDFDLVS